ETGSAILLGQSRNLGRDGLLALPDHEAGRGPIDEAEKRQHGNGEQRQIDERQPEGGGVEEISQAHAANIRRPAPCGGAADRNSCRSCCAGGSCARRSRSSEGRNGTPRRSPGASFV